ncbi:MAG: IS66-like element accessory protein TnpA [Curvibacter sp.]
MEQFSNDGRPRRREYSKAFKAQVVAQCRRPGASVGGVALAHGLHPNMVHRWIREARQDQAFALNLSQGEPAAFVALPLPVSAAGEQPDAVPTLLQLRLERADWVIHLQCPAVQCAALLRELLR